MPEYSRGLNLTKPDEITTEEVENLEAFYTKFQGQRHFGLDFWLNNGVAHLKRYRAFASAAQPVFDNMEASRPVTAFQFLLFYAMAGYVDGVRYMIRSRHRQLRASKAQIMEAIAIAFLVVGPYGMETIARALVDFEWIEHEQPAVFPPGWAADPDALRSGLDFSVEAMSHDELDLLHQWYEKTLGEIPPYVTAMSRFRPNALKAWRNRWENCISELPKQVLPMTLLHYEVTRASVDGIRENVLLARAFGVSKEIMISEISSALIYNAVTTMSLIERTVGDILDAWPD